MKEIEAFVEEIPEEVDHWMLACRTGNYWNMSCTLHLSREAAINDMTSWCNYDEYRLVKVSLPVFIPKKEEEPKEIEQNPLENMVEI